MFDPVVNDTEDPQTAICIKYEDEFPCETDLTKFHIYSNLFKPGGELEEAARNFLSRD